MSAKRRAQALILLTIFTMIGTSLYYYYYYCSNCSAIFTSSFPKTSRPREGTTVPQCAYGKRFVDSQWFQQKFNANIQPFWTEDTIEVPRDVNAWWQKLQHSGKVDVVPIRMLRKIFDQGAPRYHTGFLTKNKDNCLTCAVVGNSGNLKNSNYGKAIDSYDAVIRFNRAPTDGFEKDVGSKTTHKILYPESSMNVPQNTSLTFLPFKLKDLEWLLSTIAYWRVWIWKRITFNKMRITILHPQFIRHVHTNWLENHGKYPSTGMIGVGLAIQLCDKIDLYGFGADNNGAWHHYWENLPLTIGTAFRQTGVHDGDAEKAFLNKLESEGVVQMHRKTGAR